jgi:hypothetical protein
LTKQRANQIAKQFLQKLNTVSDGNNVRIPIKKQNNQDDNSQKSASVKGTLGSSRQQTQSRSKQQTQSRSKQQTQSRSKQLEKQK